MTGWAQGPLLGLDLESTSPSPREARIVTACVAYRGGSDPGWTREWLADAGGDPVPPETTAIHGITTERAHRDGRPVADVALEVRDQLYDAWDAGMPVVAFNWAYDGTLLSHELERAGHDPLEVRGPCLDPAVIDKQVSRRRGSRRLGDQCTHWGVAHTSSAPGQTGGAGAHDATADALAAMRVLWRIASRVPAIGNSSPAELHERQIGWRAEQCASLQAYFRREGQPDAVVEGEWPLLPLSLPVAVLA